ncbi:MAG: hypothetical protein H0X43_02950 [Nitrosospira sp.]|nr:hypothetical protein [Nitrosospira sp.]
MPHNVGSARFTTSNNVIGKIARRSADSALEWVNWWGARFFFVPKMEQAAFGTSNVDPSNVVV